MRVSKASLVWALLCAGCGRTRSDPSPPNDRVDAAAGTGNETADAANLGTNVFALLNENLELVHFGDSSSTTTTIAKSDLGATASFSNDGKLLAYALELAPGSWEVHLASASSGQTSPDSWLVSAATPRLIWVGNGELLAWAGSEETSTLIQIAQASTLDVGTITALELDAAHQALLAVDRPSSRLLYLDGQSTPAFSSAIPGQWASHLARDGRALALFSANALSDPGLPLSTRRIQWAPPATPACTPTPQAPCPTPADYELGSVEFETADAGIVLEFQAHSEQGTKMQLASIDPSEAVTITAPPATLPVLHRNWGTDSAGNTFVVQNAEQAGAEWWLQLRAASGGQTRVQGLPGFAQYAGLSGDEQALFIVHFAKPSSTVYSLVYPPDNSTVPVALLSGSTPINLIANQPGGAGVVIGMGVSSFGEQCPSELDTGCDGEVYAISDGRTAAQPLPAGFKNVRWTPDGSGLIGNIADGSVAYVSAAVPGHPRVLGRGGFVLPARW